MSANIKTDAALGTIREQLTEAVRARKCHGCGCLHKTVDALSKTEVGRTELAPALAEARAVFIPKEYDCLGCSVCYPAIAANAFAEAYPSDGDGLDLCPTDTPSQRRGWPPLPGDYHILRYRASVAVCTLNSAELAARLARRAPEGIAIVGTLHTENLGIERVIRNILANPNIRFLLLCGEDSQQIIGHLPGQSLASLLREGIDERGRIRGARGKRPILKNVRRDQVDAFRRQVELVEAIGEESDEAILERVKTCLQRRPKPFEERAASDSAVPEIEAAQPQRLVSDPAGFFVVYLDSPRRRLVVEHYTNDGVLGCVIEGSGPAAVAAAIIERDLVTRLDHAAYLGRELARAEHSLLTGEPYVQDRAPGEPVSQDAAAPCGCETACKP